MYATLPSPHTGEQAYTALLDPPAAPQLVLRLGLRKSAA